MHVNLHDLITMLVHTQHTNICSYDSMPGWSFLVMNTNECKYMPEEIKWSPILITTLFASYLTTSFIRGTLMF
jgi:hypothetical protein